MNPPRQVSHAPPRGNCSRQGQRRTSTNFRAAQAAQRGLALISLDLTQQHWAQVPQPNPPPPPPRPPQSSSVSLLHPRAPRCPHNMEDQHFRPRPRPLPARAATRVPHVSGWLSTAPQTTSRGLPFAHRRQPPRPAKPHTLHSAHTRVQSVSCPLKRHPEPTQFPGSPRGPRCQLPLWLTGPAAPAGGRPGAAVSQLRGSLPKTGQTSCHTSAPNATGTSHLTGRERKLLATAGPGDWLPAGTSGLASPQGPFNTAGTTLLLAPGCLSACKAPASPGPRAPSLPSCSTAPFSRRPTLTTFPSSNSLRLPASPPHLSPWGTSLHSAAASPTYPLTIFPPEM